MNQILFSFNDNGNQIKLKSEKILNRKNFYLYILISLIILIIIIFSLIIYNKYSIYKKSNDTEKVLSAYNISTLYSSSNTYSAIELSNDIAIIGLIEIPKINISYPILSNADEDILKISVCRFSGPLPNRIGNLCIAGHNYKNNMMFSRLDELNINDKIYISDLNKNKLEYTIYSKYTTLENDWSCTSESNNIEITLITCNKSNNTKRVVVKAKVTE